MNTFRLSAIIFLTFSLFTAQDVFAHGGAHQPKEKEVETAAPPAMDSMYSSKENKLSPLPSSPDNGFDTIFSPGDLFVEGEVLSPSSMEGMKMEGNHNEHAESQKVEIARHKRVSSSSKGFGTAIGITLFAGVVFAGLTFLRPGE